MATAAVANDATSTIGQPIVTTREDYTVGFNLTKSLDPQTQKEVVSKEPAFYATGDEEGKAAVQKLINDGKFEEAYTVTTSLPIAKTEEGMKSICPDEDERCGNFNRGAKQKAANRLKAVLLDVNADGEFTFGEDKLVNGVYDQTSDIASPSKRKVLTEEEKLDRFLEQFPEAIRQPMKAAYASAKAV